MLAKLPCAVAISKPHHSKEAQKKRIPPRKWFLTKNQRTESETNIEKTGELQRTSQNNPNEKRKTWHPKSKRVKELLTTKKKRNL